MFDFMADRAPDEDFTVEADPALEADTPTHETDGAEGGERPAWLQAHMSEYQKQRQNVYDRTLQLLRRGNSFTRSFDDHREKETAKAEAGLVRAQAGISRARGDQLYWIQSLLLFDGARRAGYASRVDLTAAMMDVHRTTAKNLVYLADRIDEGTINAIRKGRLSYVRVLEETRLREAGAAPEQIQATRRLDLGRVKRFLAKLRKMTRTDEKRIFNGQYISFQPSLDESHYRVAGQLGGYEGEICRQALQQRADRITPPASNNEDGQMRPDAGLRRALALTSMCQDELDQTTDHPHNSGQTGTAEDLTARVEDLAAWEQHRADHTEEEQPESETDHADETDHTIRREHIDDILHTARRAAGRNRRQPLLMIVADQQLAEQSNYEQGVNILGGPRIGPDTIDLIHCTGKTEHHTITEHGILTRGTKQQIRPSLRRAVLARDDGCLIDGCTNTHRLEVHHITPQSQGGTHQADNPRHPLLVPPPRRRPPQRTPTRPPLTPTPAKTHPTPAHPPETPPAPAAHPPRNRMTQARTGPLGLTGPNSFGFQGSRTFPALPRFSRSRPPAPASPGPSPASSAIVIHRAGRRVRAASAGCRPSANFAPPRCSTGG